MLPEPVQGKILSSRRVLKVGSSGKDVYELQTWLKESGYLEHMPDGRFGIVTEEAVKQLQRDYGLIADGIVGRKTRGLIRSGGVFKNHFVHMVRKGESLSDVSRLYGVNEKIIARLNKLQSFGRVWEGQPVAIWKRVVMGMVSPEQCVDMRELESVSREGLDAVIVPLVHVKNDNVFPTREVKNSTKPANMLLRVNMDFEGSSGEETDGKLHPDEGFSQDFVAKCLELARETGCGLCFDLVTGDETECVAFSNLLDDLRKKLSEDALLGILVPVQIALSINMKVLARICSSVDWISLGVPVETRIEPASYEDIRQALARLVTVIPRWKLTLTIVGYGVHVACGRHNYTRCIRFCEAEKLAYRYGVKACWNEELRTYTFDYRSRRTEYFVRYHGIRGLRARCALVNKFNIGGVLVCYIDISDEEVWDTIGSYFVPARTVPLTVPLYGDSAQ